MDMIESNLKNEVKYVMDMIESIIYSLLRYLRYIIY